MTTRFGTSYADHISIFDPSVSQIYGFGGDDIINVYAPGAKIIDAGSGHDRISAGNGDDVLHGGSGNDTISGGFGNDVINGGTDPAPVDDVYAAPRDSDTVSYAYGYAMTVDLAAGTATTRLQAKPESANWTVESDTLIEIENVTGSLYADRLVGDNAVNVLRGNFGDDSLFGRGGDDDLFGDIGDDVIYGDSGNDELQGGDGRDSLHDGTGRDLLDGGNGDDLLYTDAVDFSVDRLHGGDGNDNAFLRDIADVFDGGSGIDSVGFNQAAHAVRVDLSVGKVAVLGEILPAAQTLFNVERAAGSEFGDILKGSAGNNLLSGGGGSDVLYGGAGGDLLTDGTGNDHLYGEAGSDHFQFLKASMSDHGQHDVIGDFSAGDRVRLVDFGFDFADFDSNGDGLVTGADAAADRVGNSLVLTLSDAADWTVELIGVSQLREGDFLFMN
ncbi:calcium-binding protein [Methylobrevis pamukkalensis]|uniref:Bifunctional hemolysin/adenylate cyclase n=1 Tax=Methylobrevis pamukkalensis TaxID=1439726 RepID=A0A1E3H6D9_9HYPH|nr:calcium-binding protein [Methylobrevis pamukkalensis]ODN71899.1 Bifunctional hemolysin/adenylate cyclase precursor [Methylobrevis pamukkalensis]